MSEDSATYNASQIPDPAAQVFSPTPPPIPDSRAGSESETPGKKKRSFFGRVWHGCLLTSFFIVLAMLLGIICTVWGCSRAISAGVDAISSLDSLHRSDDFELEEVNELNLEAKESKIGDDAPFVLYVPLTGEISASSVPRRPWEDDTGSAPSALRAIRRATLDERISGILLRVDSPGGEVTASDEIWKAIEDFRASAPKGVKKPRFVVAIMGSLAASGGYYACAGADWIVAHPTTLTGSIGVKMTSFNVRRLAERLGVGEVAITSGSNKNMLSPFEDLSDEQRAMLQAQVDAMHERFVSIVAAGRKMDVEKVRAIADGRVLLAPEAEKLGLVDELGYISDAKARVIERTGETPIYVSYSSGSSLLSSLFSPDFLGASIRKAFPEASRRGTTLEAGL